MSTELIGWPVVTYPDGETSVQYLAGSDPAKVKQLTREQIEAAADMPPAGRAAYFAAIAGYVAKPEPAAESTKPMPWRAAALAEAKKLVEALVADGLTYSQIAVDPVLEAFAASRRHTVDSVLAKVKSEGVAVPEAPVSPFRAEVQEKIANRDALAEAATQAAKEAPSADEELAHLANATAYRNPDLVSERQRQAAEAAAPDYDPLLARVQAHLGLEPTGIDEHARAAADAMFAVATSATEPSPPIGIHVEPADVAAAVEVPADDTGIDWGALADQLDADPAATTADPVGVPDVDPTPAMEPAQPSPTAAIDTTLPAEPVAVPIYTWEQFCQDVSATDTQIGVSTQPFVIDDVNRLAWYGRKLTGFAEEVSELTANYQRLLDAIGKRRAAFEKYFGPQAERFVREELERQGGKRKSLDTLGGTFAFRSTKDRLEKLDTDAAVAWAEKHLPDAIKTKTTVSVDHATVETHWRNTGEIPDGYDLVFAGESFSHKPAKQSKE